MKNKIIPFSVFEGVENETRLSKSMTDILNQQIQKELKSSQFYRAMSCWLDDKGWIDASVYYFKSAQEEFTHMDKVYQYLFDRNVRAIVPEVSSVEQEFEDIRDVVEKSLKHEIEITKNWENISDMADRESDNTTYKFAQWFLKEQMSEENKFRDMLDKMNLDMPKWKIDELFKDLYN